MGSCNDPASHAQLSLTWKDPLLCSGPQGRGLPLFCRRSGGGGSKAVAVPRLDRPPAWPVGHLQFGPRGSFPAGTPAWPAMGPGSAGQVQGLSWAVFLPPSRQFVRQHGRGVHPRCGECPPAEGAPPPATVLHLGSVLPAVHQRGAGERGQPAWSQMCHTAVFQPFSGCPEGWAGIQAGSFWAVLPAVFPPAQIRGVSLQSSSSFSVL